ncbi:hypothetical protein HOLleu_19421 [Holothuria leucospilota]|uniref:Uncharacterized protein n=1 Tax=Holothuria leucospilota TaxID=206669 RepID=A0A9Q1C017_HOLLE|nr:hypothetical protein HOLleu_19421 [Holothuria leucospilota]
MWMRCSENMNAFVFSGGQRSSGVTGVKKQNFKNSQDRLMGSPEVKMQIFPTIPKIKYEPKIIFPTC